MKEQNFKKLGFFSAFAICIGSIVGIGIFFKNGSIAGNVGGNGAA
jgi:amino acid transporter